MAYLISALKGFDNGILQESGRDSYVGIATPYGLDGPGIGSRWRWDFPHPSRPFPEPTLSPVQWVPGVFPRVKAAGAWRWPPNPIQRRG